MKSLKHKEHYINNYNHLNNSMREFTSYFVELLDKSKLLTEELIPKSFLYKKNK